MEVVFSGLVLLASAVVGILLAQYSADRERLFREKNAEFERAVELRVWNGKK